MDHRGVAEAYVHGGRAFHVFQSPVEGAQSVLPRLLRARLHVGLVDLHDIGPCGEQIVDFRVHRDRIIHRGFFLRFVEIVLRLLAHGERAGHGHLDPAISVRAQELHVVDLDRMLAADLPCDARHGVGVPRAVERRAGIVDVHPLQCRGEAVGVALAAHLAIGDDVQAGFLLGADREQRRIVLGLREKRLGDAPQFFRAHARRKAPGESLAVDQPLGLRVASDQGRREKLRQGFSPWKSFSRPSLMPEFPSYRKMSAVAKVSLKLSGMKEPVPTASSGALQFANILHLNRLKPDEPTILQALKPLASSTRLSWITAATDTPVPNSTLRTRSLTIFRLSASNASSPITWRTASYSFGTCSQLTTTSTDFS